MAYRQEELVAEIIEESGLLPRRWQKHRQSEQLTKETTT
jgi:hypothetical protein